MRRILLLLASAAAVGAAALASSAQALMPWPGPDLGVAGGGYTLVNPTGPNVEWNRARFEFALRESQNDGTIRGKSLTVRVLGYDMVTQFVLRSWTTTPGYKGIPPYPLDGALVSGCSLMVGGGGEFGGPMMLDFSGVADVFVVMPGGFEVPYLQMPQLPYSMHGYDFGAMPMPDQFMLFVPGAPPLPFPLPMGQAVSGNIGGIDGVKAPVCQQPV